MSRPLKDRNRLPLALIVGANLILFAALLLPWPTSLASWLSWRTAFGAIAPVGLGAALITVMNGLLDPTTKARLVFMRWRDPLPGSRAFSQLAHEDQRVDPERLKKKIKEEIPSDGAGQNALWYRLYKPVSETIQVTEAHSNYLFARDYTALAAISMFVLGAMSIVSISDFRTVASYLSFLLLQFLLVRTAAANYGNRLVTTVLALKSASR